jgi:hypothetical protein
MFKFSRSSDHTDLKKKYVYFLYGLHSVVCIESMNMTIDTTVNEFIVVSVVIFIDAYFLRPDRL